MSQPFCGKRRLRDSRTLSLFGVLTVPDRDREARELANALWVSEGDRWDSIPSPSRTSEALTLNVSDSAKNPATTFF